MAQSEGKSARKYAKALFELSVERASAPGSASALQSLEVVRAALSDLANAWHKSSELRVAMANPAITLVDRTAAIRALSERIVPNHPAISNALVVLLEHGKLGILSQIGTVFSELVDEYRKLLALKVTSAYELSAQEKGAIEQQVRKEIGDASTVSWSVNPEILGGLTIKIGDKLLDSSVKGAFERAKAALL